MRTSRIPALEVRASAVAGLAAGAVAIVLAATVAAQSSPSFALFRYVIGAGGGRSAAPGSQVLLGTAGQPAVGHSTAPGLRLSAGFWWPDARPRPSVTGSALPSTTAPPTAGTSSATIEATATIPATGTGVAAGTTTGTAPTPSPGPRATEGAYCRLWLPNVGR